jgi:putative MFS transporter
MLELLERQKSLTVNQWKIISAAILGDMLDFFDFFLIGYALAFIVGQWKLTFLESGTILLAAGIGAIPGAFFWGWMADRIGRRKVFVATVLNFSLATGLMAASPDQYGWLFLAFCACSSGSALPGWSRLTYRWCKSSCRRRSAALWAASSPRPFPWAARWAPRRAPISDRPSAGVDYF